MGGEARATAWKRVDPLTTEEIYQNARHIAPVLERMVELLGASERRLTFGDALEQAKRETGITTSKESDDLLLRCAFKLIANGRIPGAADA